MKYNYLYLHVAPFFISLFIIASYFRKLKTGIVKIVEMASSLSGNLGSVPPNSINHKEVRRHVLSLFRSHDSFHDMKIVMRDGEVFANSAVMADASDYFATMLNNPNFVESQTKEVLMMEYGTVKAMGQIVDYVYTGVMKLDEEVGEGFMDFENLLEILNILRMMLMKDDKLYRSIETYIKTKISLQDPCPLHWLQKEMFRGFILVEKYQLDSLKKYVLNEISASLVEFKVDIEMIQDLPVELVKEIMLYRRGEDQDEDPPLPKWEAPSTRDRFDFFASWITKNQDCDVKEKKIILDSIKLSDFSGEELLTVIKESGLFSEKKIVKKCIKKFRKKCSNSCCK